MLPALPASRSSPPRPFKRVVARVAVEEVDRVVALQRVGELSAAQVLDVQQGVDLRPTGRGSARHVDVHGQRAAVAQPVGAIGSGAAVENVVAGSPDQRIVAAESLQVVRSEGPGQCLAVRGSIDRVKAGVVVLDQTTGRGRADDRAVGRAGEGDLEALVGLDQSIAVHADHQRLAGLAGGEAMLPEGSTPPVKSAALAGLAPLPATAQATA